MYIAHGQCMSVQLSTDGNSEEQTNLEGQLRRHIFVHLMAIINICQLVLCLATFH